MPSPTISSDLKFDIQEFNVKMEPPDSDESSTPSTSSSSSSSQNRPKRKQYSKTRYAKKPRIPHYKCKKCNFRTDCPNRRKKHEECHSIPGKKMAECDICHAQFCFQTGLQRHQQSQCQFFPIESPESSLTSSEGPSEPSPFEGSEFARMTVRAFLQQMDPTLLLPTKEKTPEPEVSEVPEVIPEEVTTIKEYKGERWDCNECKIWYTDETSFVLHRFFHTKNEPFVCSVCGAQCKNAYYFNKHIIMSDHQGPEIL